MRTKLRCSNYVLTGTVYFTKKTLDHDHRRPIPHTSQAATQHPPEQGPQRDLEQEGVRAGMATTNTGKEA